jgi:hypothetical protein
LIPSDLIDSWLWTFWSFIKTKFSFHFEKIEKNLEKTFPIELKVPILKPSIFLWHPHSLFSVACTLHNCYKLKSEYIPTKLGTVGFFHNIPIIKDIVRVGNFISADFDILKDTLQKESISIILGGVREAMVSSENEMILVMKERIGIFKLALETGSDLVPVLVYGETKLFPPIKSSIIDSINSFLYSNFKLCIMLPSLTSLKNWFKIWRMPLKEVKTFVGQPLKVDKKENPSLKDIQNLKTKYIARVEQLFKETNSGEYSLTIV